MQFTTLNVAFISSSTTLLTVLVSNNFVSLRENNLSIDIYLVVIAIINQVSSIINHSSFRTPAL